MGGESDRVMVTFEPIGKKGYCRHGEDVLTAATRAGVKIRSECGGKGTCGKCLVIAASPDRLSGITESERKLIPAPKLGSGWRLACQSTVTGDVTIAIPEESRVGERRILVKGVERALKVEPAIEKVYLEMPRPSLEDLTPDAERILAHLPERLRRRRLEIDSAVLKTIPSVLRNSDWKVTVTVWNSREIVLVEAGDTTREVYGVAVDIGTSKIIAYLNDLHTGESLATASIENPQIVRGEDVITRISYAMKGAKNLEELQKLVVGGINRVIAEACEHRGIKPDQISEMTVVGNTAMHHIFLGVEPKYISLAPYTPALRGPLDVKAREYHVRTSPGGTIHVLPTIAGFVGSDNIGDILATNLHRSRETCLLLDIGTNTEVTLGDRVDMLSCSCASGPAFEGAHIRHGMKAVTGAIERVRIDPESLEVTYQTIGGAKPLGICGSAMIDIMAEMLKARLLDRGGRMREGATTPRLIEEDGTLSFVLASRKETGTNDAITVTQKDIRELQLAKAAIHTGCSILMKRKGVGEKDVRKIFLAGAFGNYIDPANAVTIGLVPDIPPQRILFVGNAAGSGATIALLSKTKRKEASRLSRQVRYLELAADPDFQSEFTSSLYLPHRNSQRFPSQTDIIPK